MKTSCIQPFARTITLTALTALAAPACSFDIEEIDDPAIVAGAATDSLIAADAKDPLGIDLAAVGLSAGDRPCGDAAHVASIADEAGRYLAFCVSPSGDTSVFQVTPGGVAPVGAPSACALDTFLAASPKDAAVPRALIAACKGAAPSRRVSEAPVVVNTAALGGVVITAPGPCESASLFINVNCAAITDYATHPQIADQVTWCSVGPFTGSAQRTASAQGLPGAFEGRQTVAACGTATTNLKGYVKGLGGAWAVPLGASVNISPGHVATRDVHLYDVPETDSFGTDLRFTVTPSEGAWYRYTGAYIEFYAEP